MTLNTGGAMFLKISAPGGIMFLKIDNIQEDRPEQISEAIGTWWDAVVAKRA